MKQIDLKKVMAWLGFVLRCPICNVKYNLQNIKILESLHDDFNEGARILIHSDCEHCKSSLIFNIDINGPDVFTVGMLTDLTGKDSARFSELEPITANDVLRIHSGLKTFDGNLVRALQR